MSGGALNFTRSFARWHRDVVDGGGSEELFAFSWCPHVNFMLYLLKRSTPAIADDSALRVLRAAILKRVTGTPFVDWSLGDVFEVGF